MAGDFTALASEVEAEHALKDDLAERVRAAIAGFRPDLDMSVESLRSTDALLHLTDSVVPGWSIQLRGKAREPDGHWTCVIRRSLNSDNDEFIATGRGPMLGLAILAATLRTLGYLKQRA